MYQEAESFDPLSLPGSTIEDDFNVRSLGVIDRFNAEHGQSCNSLE